MLLCSENTASAADSTQNKMILHHLSENPCLQRRKEESGHLQELQVEGGNLKMSGPEQQGGHCKCHLNK